MPKPAVRAAAALALCLECAATTAAAAAPVPITFGVGAATEYEFRGISQTRGRPDGFASADAEIGSLGYAGVWASNVDFTDGARAEIDLYGGVRPKLGPVTVDLGVIRYAYARQRSGPHLDYTEIKVAPSMQLGPATFGAAWYHSEDFLGRSGASNYVEVNASTSLATTPFSLSAAVGHQAVARLPDYTTWNLGVGYAVNDHLGFDLRYWDTDAHNQGSTYGSRVVFGVKATFP
jgi:uncharacterized protein (TIGR02001 family)